MTTLHKIFQNPLPGPSEKGNKKVPVSFLEERIVILTENLTESLENKISYV